MRIDACVSFCDRSRFHYPWMASAPAHMQRDFTPEDLWRILSRNRFEGAVVRPALGTGEEREWLQELEARHPWILAVAGPRPDIVETGGFDETPEADLIAAAGVPSLSILIRGATLASAPELKRFVPKCLSLFGAARIMWGSRWPFCMDLGNGEIGIWKESLAAFTQALGAQSRETREWILGGTAARIYTARDRVL
jgi:predicted TIM-barrel fold metal-dependent hydrolase